MVILAPGDRCLLCGCLFDVGRMAMHLRSAHQIVPGERTVADVPEGRSTALHMMTASGQREEDLVGAGSR